MATKHLTNDNGEVIGATDGAEGENHLAGIDKTAPHLVVVRQPSDWTDKEMVLVPKEKKFAWADAWGKEAYPNSQVGTLVGPDTDALVAAANARLSAAAWQTGDKAVFAHFARSYDPRCVFADLDDMDEYAGICRSAVALKFDFRHLHFSRMSGYKVFVRAYQPSLLVGDPFMALSAVMIPGGIHGGASQLCVRFADELPERADTVTDGDSNRFELAGSCNNGVTVDVDTNTDLCNKYDPFAQEQTRPADSQNLLTWAYVTNKDRPAEFHHDFELTGAQKDYFLRNPGETWLLAEFARANGFSDGTYWNCLMPRRTATAYVQRLEIVVKCTGGKVNA